MGCLAPERRYGGKGSRNRLPGQAVSARTERGGPRNDGAAFGRNDGTKRYGASREALSRRSTRLFAQSMASSSERETPWRMLAIFGQVVSSSFDYLAQKSQFWATSGKNPERGYGGKGSRNRLPGQAVSARTGRARAPRRPKENGGAKRSGDTTPSPGAVRTNRAREGLAYRSTMRGQAPPILPSWKAIDPASRAARSSSSVPRKRLPSAPRTHVPALSAGRSGRVAQFYSPSIRERAIRLSISA